MATLDEVMRTEIAPVWRDPMVPQFSGLLRPDDDTLATRGGARGIRIYEELERDPQVWSCLQTRIHALVGREWYVEAAGEDQQSQAAAELVRAQLAAAPFDRACAHLMRAILLGYSVVEVVWDVRDGTVVLADLVPRRPSRFVFDTYGRLRLLTPESPVEGELLPDRKFVVHRYGNTDNPYGLGLGTRLFWPVWFKREGIRMWLQYAERFGFPTVLGKYPPGTGQEDQQRLLEALRAMARESGIIMPQTMQVELLEATRQSSTDLYRSLCDYMDAEIARIILGQGGRQESGGELASAVLERARLRREILQADADLLSETLNGTLVRWIVELNMPGAAPPRVYRRTDDPEPLSERAKRDEILFRMGYQPTEQYVLETYGEGYRLLGAPSPQQGVALQEPRQAVFPDQDAIDAAAENADLMRELVTATLELVRPLLEEVRRGADPVALRRRLAELYPAMNSAQLEELMRRVVFAADVAGRLSALE
jgi:phage gp29-like protein